MNIVDSSGWLEFFAGSPQSSYFEKIILDTSKLLVPTICSYEIFKKVLTQFGEDKAIKAVGHMKMAQVIDINFEISIMAAKISCENKIPMADSMIYACAKKYKAVLYTQDEDFKNLPGVQYFKKLSN